MGGFYSQEYKHLLAAERSLADEMENFICDPVQKSMMARALVAVIDQKRMMRMKPKPKPVEVVSEQRKPRSSVQPDSPTDPSAK